MATKNNSQEEKAKSGTAAVIAGVLVIIAGFSLYNYFSNIGENDGEISNEAAQEKVVNEYVNEDGKEDVEKETFLEKLFGRNNDNGKESNEADLNLKEDLNEEAGIGGAEPSYYEQETWVATDYNQGDISTSSYTVKKGDTLWEIAEAKYGSGFEWAKIRDANTIETLWNGNPLITPGQVLVLPE